MEGRRLFAELEFLLEEAGTSFFTELEAERLFSLFIMVGVWVVIGTKAAPFVLHSSVLHESSVLQSVLGVVASREHNFNLAFNYKVY